MTNSALFNNLWVEKYRPTKLEEIVLTEENRKFFEDIKKKQEMPHLMFSGNPGTGKTTLAKIIVNDILDCQYLYINASDESGVETIRSKVMNFAQTKSIDGKIKAVILDECDGLSSTSGSAGRTSAQQALRNIMEEYAGNTRFILTCNYPYKVIPALHSRCQEFDLTPPFEECVKRCVVILNSENIKVENGNRKKLFDLIKSKYPDLRRVINTLQKNVINGELKITDISDENSFAKEVFNKIVSKQDPITIREFIIQNEISFGNDYHQLLKDMFEVIFKTQLDFNKKRLMLLAISNAMYQHQIVMDTEINAFACILQITELV